MNGDWETASLLVVELGAMLSLLCASGFFSSSETALFSLTLDELRRFRVGGRGERLVVRLLSDPERLLTAILFWNLVVNLAYFTTSIIVTQQLIRAGQPGAAAGVAGGSFIALVLFGEVLPKTAAVLTRHRLAPLLSWPLSAAVRLFYPLAPFFRVLTVLLRRAFWPDVPREAYLDIEDLERAVESSELDREVQDRERDVLQAVLGLSEIDADEVLRPRGSYAVLTAPVSRSHLARFALETDYVAISTGDTPEDFDRLLVLDNLTQVPEEHVENCAEETIVVPWCAELSYVLQTLRHEARSGATVVDEYGETAGLLTFDDILDTVLLPHVSRARRLLRREPVVEVSPGQYAVEGITTLRYLAKKLNLEYEPEEDDPVTVAGLIAEQLERLPQVGDECVWRGYRIRVTDVTRRGQIRVVVSDSSESLASSDRHLPG